MAALVSVSNSMFSSMVAMIVAVVLAAVVFVSGVVVAMVAVVLVPMVLSGEHACVLHTRLSTIAEHGYPPFCGSRTMLRVRFLHPAPHGFEQLLQSSQRVTSQCTGALSAVLLVGMLKTANTAPPQS